MRRPCWSELMALNIDSPGEDSFFGMHSIKPVGYGGATGDGTLDLVGFDVEIVDERTLRFWLINQRPPVDANKKYLDPKKIGGKRNCGCRKEFDLLIGGGNVAYCASSGTCHPTTANKLFFFSNGLTRGADGLVYVPSSLTDGAQVMRLNPNGILELLDVIKLGILVDSLAVYKKGDIYAAGLPKFLEIIGTMDDPFGKDAPSTVWRITRDVNGYTAEKILEDKEKRILSGVTTARHDVKTRRLSMGAALTPYMMICDPK
ncbi:uncharacterized protein BP5553_04456 [Venustampulla echinocandica]|uniref:Uncharacterized protein n=1 Tax=Venustampulla echinocandica TaxID=2656787 RepID=A0A370TNB7_9HELO|nr:uncharacterized protein BP5553_04456 [Venustampulla echinocandica]RDL37023.1 hypothetical protein BP5553_04456 [Venustampulla echinocandica]